MAEETLVFRRAGFSPALWLLVPAFSLPNAPPWVIPLASARLERSPTACVLHRGAKLYVWPKKCLGGDAMARA